MSLSAELDDSSESESVDSAGSEKSAPPPHVLRQLSTSELRRTIQSSDVQLYDGLNSMGAIEMDGAWRLLHPELSAAVLSHVLSAVDASDLKLESLNPKTVASQYVSIRSFAHSLIRCSPLHARSQLHF